MIPFLAALTLGVLAAIRLFGGQRQAVAATVALLALPTLYATLLLTTSFERLDALELRYVGKRLAWGPDLPLTGGGGGADSGVTDDLSAAVLAPGAMEIVPVDADRIAAWNPAADGPAPPRAGTPVLRLSSPAPVVEADGRVLNAVRLEDGDVLRVRAGDAVVERIYRDGTLEGGAEPISLSGGLLDRLRAKRVRVLKDLPGFEDADTLSYLDDEGGWHAVVRDDAVTISRDGLDLDVLGTPHPLSTEVEVALRVVTGARDQRRLREVRRDRLRFGDDRVEVRFAEPERRRIPLGDEAAPVVRGLVVPSARSSQPEVVEIQERSRRFHGLSATLSVDPATETFDLDYQGHRRALEEDRLYGLGTGEDQLLLTLERTPFPVRVLVDLALPALFLGVFLWRGLLTGPGLGVLTGATGMLLAHRLVFSYRAATQPPDFFLRGYGDARLALWLVPALILFGWTLGFLLRKLGAAPESTEATARRRLERATRLLRWPLGGLLTAAMAGWWTTRGLGVNVSVLAAGLPLLLAGLLVLTFLWAAGRTERPRRWHASGWSWAWWGAVAAGAAILVWRLIFLGLGMPEAFRVPTTSFRLLWSAVQLPVAALVVGLACRHVAGRTGATDGDDSPARGLLALWAFLALAFLAVGFLARDLGLLLVHGLAVVVALALLGLRRPGPRWGPAATALALTPLVLVLVLNLLPAQTARFVGGAVSLAASDEPIQNPDEDGSVEDPAAVMRASSNPQLFRLYMLANPDHLQAVGTKPAERVALQYATIKSYARQAGLAGHGFHSSRLPSHLGVTYLNDLMPMAFVLADFGRLGMLGLALVYLILLASAVPAFGRSDPMPAPRSAVDPWAEQGAWIAVAALLFFTLPGLYMLLANLNLVLFTGKNSTLLSLNSVSDVLQAGALLAVAAFGLALADTAPARTERRSAP